MKLSKIKESNPQLLCECCFKQNCNRNCIWLIKFCRWINKKLYNYKNQIKDIKL